MTVLKLLCCRLNDWTKCSQQQNVCSSHLQNEALDFDVKQAEMGGGVSSSFTDSPPTMSLCCC